MAKRFEFVILSRTVEASEPELKTLWDIFETLESRADPGWVFTIDSTEEPKQTKGGLTFKKAKRIIFEQGYIDHCQNLPKE
jgi:hypothetical protein